LKNIPWFGVGLIVVGVAMMLDRFNILSFGWWAVIWSLIAVSGIMKAVHGFSNKRSGRVFWGTFLFLLGTYGLLRDIDVIELRSYWWLPAMILIVGFSLMMMYMSTPKEWHLLIPALVLLGTGAAMVLTEFGYFYRYDVVEAIRRYWPAALILFGLSLVLRGRFSSSKS
jgi:hypothetical protein